MSRYCSWAVMDMEAWSGRPATVQAQMQQGLDAITTRALQRCGIDGTTVGRTSRGDGWILSFAGEVAKERLTEEFVEELRDAIEDHNLASTSAAAIRLRLALHAGDAIDGGGQWAGRPVVLVCRLVDSDLLRRVLAAARGQALAVIVSSDWYEAVVREGHASSTGYERVWVVEKDVGQEAWVRVPGRTRPPGLLPIDAVGTTSQPHADPVGPPSRTNGTSAGEGSVGRSQHIDTRGASFGGDLVGGDKVVHHNHYGAGARPSNPLEPS